MLTFEEFHTTQKRQRAWKEAIEKKDIDSKEGSSTSPEKKAAVNQEIKDVIQSRTSLTVVNRRIGAVLEGAEIQLFIVGLIYLDLVASIIIFVLENDVGTLTNTAKIEKIIDTESTIFRLTSSLSNFTTFCFVIDICGLMYAFGLKFFSHIGYTIDFCVIMSVMWNNLNNNVLDLYFPVQLLGFLRCWRVSRLVATLVANVEQKHEETKIKLHDVEIRLQNQKKECNMLEASKSSETKLRKQVERLVQAYKDEVETLKEALKIAALDVAAATAEGLIKEDQKGEPKEEDDEAGMVDEEGDKFYDGAVTNE